MSNLEARSRLRAAIIEKLKDGPLSLDETTELLADERIPYKRSVANEISWAMVEEGIAKFNDNWLLELVNTGAIANDTKKDN